MAALPPPQLSIAGALSPLLNPCFRNAINSLGWQTQRRVREKPWNIRSSSLDAEKWSPYEAFKSSNSHLGCLFLLQGPNSSQYTPQISSFNRRKPGLCTAFCLSTIIPQILVTLVGFTYSFPTSCRDFQYRMFLGMETCWVIIIKSVLSNVHRTVRVFMLKLKTTVTKRALDGNCFDTYTFPYWLLWLLFWVSLKDPAGQILLSLNQCKSTDFNRLHFHHLRTYFGF